MSFTTEIKNELCGGQLGKKSAKILLYGFLYGLKDYESGFFTDSQTVRDFLESLMGKDNVKIARRTKQGRKGWLMQIIGEPLKKTDYKSAEIDRSYVDGSDSSTGLFLRGVFISCGVVADPNKEYHLELTASAEKSHCLFRLINESGMQIKESVRKNQPFLYTKDSEGISDFLTFIGAMISSMEIMNAKIVKGVRNNINRVVNCEAANIGKTVAASQKQIADIQYIKSAKGLEFLTDDLRQIAQMRLEHAEMSLRELGELTEPKISRSGVNHRLRRISEIADKLRNS